MTSATVQVTTFTTSNSDTHSYSNHIISVPWASKKFSHIRILLGVKPLEDFPTERGRIPVLIHTMHLEEYKDIHLLYSLRLTVLQKEKRRVK